MKVQCQLRSVLNGVDPVASGVPRLFVYRTDDGLQSMLDRQVVDPLRGSASLHNNEFRNAVGEH